MELQIKEEAPLFSLPNQDNAEISLRDFRGSYVVLYFYPKDKTPGCTTEACDFRDSMESLNALGAVVLGVSPDSVKSHQSFIGKESLNFTLLSDTNKEVLKMYGAFGVKKLYGKEYEGVIRSTFPLIHKVKSRTFGKMLRLRGILKRLERS